MAPSRGRVPSQWAEVAPNLLPLLRETLKVKVLVLERSTGSREKRNMYKTVYNDGLASVGKAAVRGVRERDPGLFGQGDAMAPVPTSAGPGRPLGRAALPER